MKTEPQPLRELLRHRRAEAKTAALFREGLPGLLREQPRGISGPIAAAYGIPREKKPEGK